MSFASPIFLWYFLPAVLLLSWIMPQSCRNAVVAVASLIFYAVGAGPTTLLLLSCILINFSAGLTIQVAADRGHLKRRKRILVWTLAIDLVALAVWKYAGFASEQVSSLAQTLGLGPSPVLEIVLPIGISFYTFHQISYVVDVYRGTRRAQLSLLGYITYVTMFPQLIAGPIVRYHEIADQLDRRRTGKLDDLLDGFPRFCLGLCKKVLVADTVAPIADAAFAVPADQLTTATAWLGATAYAIQIYFDFSGYSDMAIGLGRMFGFQLPENFARPYSAHSITDFWRRWHMSLSRWFRDYLYIPLGGSRRGPARTYFNLWVVFLLCGFWHGANWTFIIWGAYHGGLLVLERLFGLPADATPGTAAIRRGVTLLLVIFGWVLFRAESVGQAWAMLGAMLSWQPGPLADSVALHVGPRSIVVLILAAMVVFLPRWFIAGPFLQFGIGTSSQVARISTVTVGLLYSSVLVAAGTFSPFLYYQF